MSAFTPDQRYAVWGCKPDGIPGELKERPFWAYWGAQKRPIRPSGRGISINKGSGWIAFPKALDGLSEGNEWLWGIGTLLNGDGLVCVDMDQCVSNNQINPKALELFEQMGFGYIEISPSGTGLHGFGYAKRLRAFKGQINGVNVEFYAQGRFMTVTGHAIKSEVVGEINTELLDGNDKTEVTEDTDEIDVTEDTESCIPSTRQLAWEGIKLPKNCVPTGYGQRTKALFQCARFLQGYFPKSSRDDLKDFLVWWLKENDQHIRTKDWEENWTKFEEALSKVKFPTGEHWSKAVELAVTLEVPSEIEGQKRRELMKLCMALAQMSSDGEFFVSLDQASHSLGIDRSYAGALINRLTMEGRIIVTKVHTSKMARRLRLKE